jgi:RHS repeat-associated protein
VYDPLYRLKEANYSTGDYYYYIYDAVGNRLTQQTQLGTTNYAYDIANRLSSVNGVTYTWDDNGNLLNDGVNTYTYDSANRLKTLANASTTATYTYNGLNDRLQETVNGSTTTFTMDLNAGLTQALSDGTNNYIYGNGRIAQTESGATKYFLGDALSSVRQMTSASGTITYARAYDPYGVTTQTYGAAQSAYGYTGEYSGDYNNLLYLRARFYVPSSGRFLTKDTWDGDSLAPLSFNLWNYVQANPINYVDPTGNRSFCPWWWNQWAVDRRVDIAEEIVSPNSDPMNTYVAAAIAVQCAGWDEWWNNNSGIGPAQITDNQARTAYGEVIPQRYWWGGIKYDENDKPIPRNFGLCPDGEILDPMDDQDSVILMRLLLQLTIDECKGCTSTDIYIAVGLAQNGPGFNRINMSREVKKITPDKKGSTDISRDWFEWFENGQPKNNQIQLDRFTLVINELISRQWSVPDNIDWKTIELLRNWKVSR